MKQLVLFRGAPGVGKSTYIKKMGWEEYALSADDLRMKYMSPILTIDGGKVISQDENENAWTLLYNLLEERMKNGVFTVIDATNSKKQEMSNYRNLASKYGYRVFLIDLTDVPIEVTKERNRERARITPYKWVPENVIDNMYSRFKTQAVPGFIKVIDKNKNIEDQILLNKFDMNKYNEVMFIGDIHGCYSALKELIDSQGGFKDDCFYCFTGDYLDRGAENLQTMKYLLTIYNKPNVLMLEGNHEKSLRNYANFDKIRSKEFLARTRVDLEQDPSLTKKDLRLFCRSLGQCAYFDFGNATFFASHGGVPCLDRYIPTKQLIKGVGRYEDMQAVAESWAKFVEASPSHDTKPFYQVFGHRNVTKMPIKVNAYNYCLEGQVEFGGQLRAIKVLKDGTIEDVSVDNKVFSLNRKSISNETLEQISVSDFVNSAKSNKKIINVKQLNNGITSYNFTREAFIDKVWNEVTVTARGLFIDEEKQSIAARGFQKFFNIGERPETQVYELERTMQFPVKAFLKENGFLGLVSVHNGEFLFASKTTTDSEHSKYLKDIFESTITEDNKKKIKEYLEKNNRTAIFEVIDPVNDPHIIEYNFKHLVLLDVADNTLKFNNCTYKELTNLATEWGVQVKSLVKVFNDFNEFLDFIEACNQYDFKDPTTNKPVEGYVFVDGKGFMVKLKTAYYNMWKHMRSILQEVKTKGYSDRTGSLLIPTANYFYSWIVNKVGGTNQDQRDEIVKDIVTMRNKFLNENSSF